MPSFPSCIVIGGGGHARVVIDTLRLSGCATPVAIVDADSARKGTHIYDVPVAGGDEALPTLWESGIRHFVMGIAGAGDNRLRTRLYKQMILAGWNPLTVVHPSAIVSPHASVGAGCQVFPGAVVNANVCMGENVIINSGAIVEHDVTIDCHVHVAPGACVCGFTKIQEGAHIGARSVVRQGVTIGQWSLVGIGAVVVKDVADNITVAGNPAKTLK